MPHRWRILTTHEDADEDGHCIAPRTDERIWYCDDCGQPNDPRHQGGEWPTCVQCGHWRWDVDDSYQPEG